jgi:membrane associated rhomboid family serine protease
MLNNLPQVTKNILILNIMFFVATLILETQKIDLVSQFGAHYVNSPLFQPFQIVTHFFMHGGIFHIFFNMWLFVMLGAYLERIWGPKRFFIFYIAAALGAFGLYNIMGVYELEVLKNQLVQQGFDLNEINNMIRNGEYNQAAFIDNSSYHDYVINSFTPMVGASGAVFGIMAAFAILFPNTEFMIYFMFPIKAKFLVGGYLLLEMYLAYQDNAGDNTAHLAHVGGAIVGGIIVLIWRKTDKTNFW